MGVCGAERSQVLVKFLVKAAFRGEPLFRPSRPDSIETLSVSKYTPDTYTDCSGHLGRTPLRLNCIDVHDVSFRILFRPSRPDSIETKTIS